MTTEQSDYLVALMSIAVAVNTARVDRLSAMTSELAERVERAIEQVERERDYALAAADTPDEMGDVVEQSQYRINAYREELTRITADRDRGLTRIAALVGQVDLVTAERDYAVAVADSLRVHNERLERELGEALRRFVDARSTFHGER